MPSAGITWDKARRRWIVMLYALGKQHYVGRYENRQKASRLVKLLKGMLKSEGITENSVHQAVQSARDYAKSDAVTIEVPSRLAIAEPVLGKTIDLKAAKDVRVRAGEIVNATHVIILPSTTARALQAAIEQASFNKLILLDHVEYRRANCTLLYLREQDEPAPKRPKHNAKKLTI